MLTRIAVAALNRSPLMRRMIWRWWYGRLAKKFAQPSWTFMNYGLLPADDGDALELTERDEPDRLCIQLYERVVRGAGLAGKSVVEVGSGRGGGASYLARTHAPRDYIGIDFSNAAVKLCRKTHVECENLSFAQGDAENLALDDACCDVVVNVESSHCYGDVDRFFAQVVRVLRPGGHFAFADFRSTDEMEAVAGQLAALPGMRVVEDVDITERVVAALQADDERKRRLIAEIITPRLQHLFGEFAGLTGGQVFESLQRREMVYRRWLLQKA